MGVSVGKLSPINLRWINFRELYFTLWRNSNQFHSSSECKFFQAWCQAIVDNHCVSIKSSPRDPCIKFSSSFLHSPNYVYYWSHFSKLELVEHISNWNVLLVYIVDFYELCKLTSWKQEVIRLPELLLCNSFLYADDRILQPIFFFLNLSTLLHRRLLLFTFFRRLFFALLFWLFYFSTFDWAFFFTHIETLKLIMQSLR